MGLVLHMALAVCAALCPCMPNVTAPLTPALLPHCPQSVQPLSACVEDISTVCVKAKMGDALIFYSSRFLCPMHTCKLSYTQAHKYTGAWGPCTCAYRFLRLSTHALTIFAPRVQNLASMHTSTVSFASGSVLPMPSFLSLAVRADGTHDPASMHTGCPVIKGG